MTVSWRGQGLDDSIYRRLTVVSGQDCLAVSHLSQFFFTLQVYLPIILSKITQKIFNPIALITPYSYGLWFLKHVDLDSI